MAASSQRYITFFNPSSLTRRLNKQQHTCKGLSILQPVILAFVSLVFIFLYSFSNPKLLQIKSHETNTFHANPFLELPKENPNSSIRISQMHQLDEIQTKLPPEKVSLFNRSSGDQWPEAAKQIGEDGDHSEVEDDAFHDGRIFMEDYRQMNRTLKIYTYPHRRDDPFANVLLPEDSEPTGNYASESYFKKSLFTSHFLTNDPSEADLFYLPFSIASLRHDKRIRVSGIQDFVKNYIHNISHSYPYWNRTGGADHFYVACHSIGRTAMEKAVEVKLNAIQVVCSSSYFLSGYVAHKDASIPQIWPRKGEPPKRSPSQRKNLAFYAGAMNSRVRQVLVEQWENDTEISVHQKRIKTPYSESLLGSKYCIHAKGFEVNTARVGDAMYYGCVPVILADHYDLPYADILNWNSFSVIVPTVDIPHLKKILHEINFSQYSKLQTNVMRVQKHFRWHHLPVDFDAFYMIMYELWLRRSHIRLPIF